MGVRSTGSHPTTTQADGHLLEYFRQNFDVGGGSVNFIQPFAGLTATGGVISDYSDGSTIYRAHVFTTSGTFDISALSENISGGDTVEYLTVGGGGGGGASSGPTQPQLHDAGTVGGGGGAFVTGSFTATVNPF